MDLVANARNSFPGKLKIAQGRFFSWSKSWCVQTFHMGGQKILSHISVWSPRWVLSNDVWINLGKNSFTHILALLRCQIYPNYSILSLQCPWPTPSSLLKRRFRACFRCQGWFEARLLHSAFRSCLGVLQDGHWWWETEQTKPRGVQELANNKLLLCF